MKFHVTPHGAAPCEATVQACRYGEVYETLGEAEAAHEKALAADQGEVPAGISKRGTSSVSRQAAESQQRERHTTSFAPEAIHKTTLVYQDDYEDLQADAHSFVAISKVESPLQYEEILEEDKDFYEDTCSSVRRYRLASGRNVYFKSVNENFSDEETSEAFKEYKATPYRGAVNEVNAYRLAQELGPEYESLVPETTLREVNGQIGTVQVEVIQSRGFIKRFDDEGGRRAALFDSVYGSEDRHSGNYLYDDESDNHFKLIDNSFSMNSQDSRENHSMFIVRNKNESLSDGELSTVKKAGEVFDKWAAAGEISPQQHARAKERIEFIVETRTLLSPGDVRREKRERAWGRGA